MLLSGTNTYAEVALYSDLQKLPKASDDADYVIMLQSNKENTSFYVDGKFVGVGDNGDLQVLINRKKGHSITAKAPSFNELLPQGIPPNFNYSGINDKIELHFSYSDKTDYKAPKFAGTEIHIEGGNVYGPVGGGTIENQQINNQNKSASQHSSENDPRSSSRTGLGFTKENLELVKSACLVGDMFEFKTEADGTISVKNLEGKGKLHVYTFTSPTPATARVLTLGGGG